MSNKKLANRTRIHLWDLPLRIFHWTLVATVTIAVITAKVGGDWIDLHAKAGLTIIGLLAFRITWGVFGSTHARFTEFAPTPARIIRYLRGEWQSVGHNPLGALSVFALLSLLAAQAITGLFANDDIAFTGPLSALISKEASDRLTGVHHQLSNILLAFIGLHVTAVFFYLLIKRNNLIKPMITGWKEIEDEKPIFRKAAHGSFTGLLSSIIVALLAVYAANASGWVNTAAISPAPANTPITSSPAQATSTATKPAPAW